MKFFDMVRVIVDRDEYSNYEVYEGMVGQILTPEIKDNCFCVDFGRNKDCWIKIDDLRVIEQDDQDDDFLLNSLPDKNPSFWCKVEDGYIKNLLGEKKNKIAYDFDS